MPKKPVAPAPAPTRITSTPYNPTTSPGRQLPTTAEVLPAAQLREPTPVLPFDPTLDRVFTSRDTLRLYFKAVQRTATAPLTATISALTHDDQVALTFKRDLPAGPQPHLDIRLPLAQLTPGVYRLLVNVTDGAIIIAREVGFVVR
jgi:hypothetical protein